MQKINETGFPIRIISLIADIVMMTYTILYFYWMFFVNDMDTHFLTGLFTTVNPMMWGAYLLGLTMLIHLIAFKNIIGRCLLAVFYGFSVVVSLIAVMGMTNMSDLAIYLPHVVIIALAIAILARQHKQTTKNAAVTAEDEQTHD